MIFVCILVLSPSLSVFADSPSGVDVQVDKSDKGIWTLSYQLNKQVNRLGFTRNPDDSRVNRWHAVSKDFEIIEFDKKEYLRRKDRKAFSQVSVILTPTYKHLSKDYGPFSPYSDGGMLIHTGRLFACAENCDDDINAWKVTLTAPEGEHIIVNGKLYQGTASWSDKNDGKNIYVGKQKPIETESVIAVIDSGLPDEIRKSLNADIPKLMDYFESKLGKPGRSELSQGKPMLYASYAKVDGGSSQGGTLPNQIFIHWNINNLEDKVKERKFIDQTTWFFAHEVAHLHQRSNVGVLYAEENQSWLHEGNADWLAALALIELYPESKVFVEERIAKFEDNCVKGLKQFPLIEAAEKGQFGLYYTCGLLIHQAIDRAVQGKSNSQKNIYSLWNEFRLQVESGENKGPDTFLSLVENYTTKSLVKTINDIVSQKLDNPELVLKGLEKL